MLLQTLSTPMEEEEDFKKLPIRAQIACLYRLLAGEHAEVQNILPKKYLGGESIDEDGCEELMEILQQLNDDRLFDDAIEYTAYSLKAAILKATCSGHQDSEAAIWKHNLCHEFLEEVEEEFPADANLWQLKTLLALPKHHNDFKPLREIVLFVENLLKQKESREIIPQKVAKFSGLFCNNDERSIETLCSELERNNKFRSMNKKKLQNDLESILTQVKTRERNLRVDATHSIFAHYLKHAQIAASIVNRTIETKEIKKYVASNYVRPIAILPPHLEYLVDASLAAKKALGFAPRPAQLIAVLAMIHSQNEKRDSVCGNLFEISTGEGKSLIQALFAGYLVKVKNGKVDIMTSSCELAKREVAEMKPFYKRLGIDCCVLDRDGYVTRKDRKEQYLENEICYSAPGEFIFDVLKDELWDNTKVRTGRPFDYIIIDEVDKVLIDDFNHCYMISGVRIFFAFAFYIICLNETIHYPSIFEWEIMTCHMLFYYFSLGVTFLPK